MTRANVRKHFVGITALFLALYASGMASAQIPGRVSASTLNATAERHTLTVTSTSAGTVSMPGKGAFGYDHGTLVSLLAVPWTQCHFTGWTGTAVDAGKVADPASAATTVTMDEDYTLQANFAVDGYTLTVSSTSWGSVAVPGEGAFEYERSASVAIQATAENNCRFTGWTGTAVDEGKVADPAAASTTVAMEGSYTLQANFVGEGYTLTISPSEWGSVVTPGEGSFGYEPGSLVAISAVADEHSHFTGWAGTAVEAGKVTNRSFPSTTVTVDADYTLWAAFAPDWYTLTVSSTSGGSVSEPGAGSFRYDYGSIVSIAATAQADHRFTGWTGTAVTAGKVTDPTSPSTAVKIDASYTLQANFKSTLVRGFHESWETARIGGYTPARDSVVPGDEGAWLLADAISQSSECGPTPQRAQVIALGSGQALLLRSSDSNSTCSDIVSVSLTESGLTDSMVDLAIGADTILSFYEVGELDEPGLHGSGSDCLTPPCFDNISLLVSDNRGNVLAYVLQRYADANENVPNANVRGGYREIFLDPTGIRYRRNLLEDFLTIPGFDPAGAQVNSIEFRVAEHGTAILDDVFIGSAPVTSTVPVYSFWSPMLAHQLFTASAEEKQVLIDVYPDVWTFDGIAFFAPRDGNEPNAVPVYRFWSPMLLSHFYTVSEDEKDYLVREFPAIWMLEGVVFHAFGESARPPETRPTYRFWSPVLDRHFYATSEEERDFLIESYSQIWTLEGTAWYVYPASWDAWMAREIIRNIYLRNLK